MVAETLIKRRMTVRRWFPRGCVPKTPLSLRRKSEARTLPRNCSDGSGGGTGLGVCFTTAGAAAFVAFFAGSPAAPPDDVEAADCR